MGDGKKSTYDFPECNCGSMDLYACIDLMSSVGLDMAVFRA